MQIDTAADVLFGSAFNRDGDRDEMKRHYRLPKIERENV